MEGQPDVPAAARRLGSSRRWSRQGIALSAGSAAAAGVAAVVAPVLTVPLLVAAAAEALIVYFVAAARRQLTARLAVDGAYYEIPEVRTYGEGLTSPRARARLADWLMELVELGSNRETLYLGDRIADNRKVLLAVVEDLRSTRLDVHPTTLATCVSLLTRGADSPLYNRRIPADALRAALLRIRLGFYERVEERS